MGGMHKSTILLNKKKDNEEIGTAFQQLKFLYTGVLAIQTAS